MSGSFTARWLAAALLLSLAPFARGADGWPMAAANVERTSWCSEEVAGPVVPAWYRPIEPYISQNVQIIASGGLL